MNTNQLLSTERISEAKTGLLLMIRSGEASGNVALNRTIKDLQKLVKITLNHSVPFRYRTSFSVMHIIPEEELDQYTLVMLGNSVGAIGKRLGFGQLDLQVIE